MFFFVGDPFHNRSDPRLNDAVGQGSDRVPVNIFNKNAIFRSLKANNNMHLCAGDYM